VHERQAGQKNRIAQICLQERHGYCGQMGTAFAALHGAAMRCLESWRPGAESGARAGGSLSGMFCGHQKTPGRAPHDAQPGYELSVEIARLGNNSARLPQPTTLKQPQ
jgi:hypothetical protein